MVTDKQRREVAQKLREPKESLLAHPDCELIRLRREIGCARGQDLYERLADLIDPQTTPYICEKCGGEWPSDIMFERCPYCGAEVIG